MLKKITEKRIEQFKNDFPEFKISKKTGSMYIRIGVTESTKQIKYNGRAITKGTVKKLGQFQEWKQSKARFVYLLSPAGKLMMSKEGGNFRSVTLKALRTENSDLTNTFFIGKKYEWLGNYPNMFAYKFFQGFNSLSEAKKFLGYSFISDDEFSNLFKDDWFDFLTPVILAKDKKNVVRLFKDMNSETRDSLNDYINMCQEHNMDIEIPAGKNKLEELHDSAMWEINKRNMNCYSKEYKYDIKEEFTKIWQERKLIFRRLETPYEMYAQGIKQIHCIGTNYATQLGYYAFYTFNYKDKEYDIQLYKNGSVGQFYGRKNTEVPKELKELVLKDINLKLELTDIKPNLENYPKIADHPATITNGWAF